jgi:hypothetical protein
VALLGVIGKGWIDAHFVFPRARIVSARSIAARSRWPQTVQSFPFSKSISPKIMSFKATLVVGMSQLPRH